MTVSCSGGQFEAVSCRVPAYGEIVLKVHIFIGMVLVA